MTKINDQAGNWTLYATHADVVAKREVHPSNMTLRCNKTKRAWWPYSYNPESELRNNWGSLGFVRSVEDEGWGEVPVPTAQAVMMLRPYLSLEACDDRLREILIEIESMQGE